MVNTGENRIRQRRADLFTRESRFIKAIGIDEKIAPIERYHAANAGSNEFVCTTTDVRYTLLLAPLRVRATRPQKSVSRLKSLGEKSGPL